VKRAFRRLDEISDEMTVQSAAAQRGESCLDRDGHSGACDESRARGRVARRGVNELLDEQRALNDLLEQRKVAHGLTSPAAKH
jgi:hypothetical protein